MTSFAVEILTPARRVFAGESESIVLPGSEGSFGVLAGHVPLLARLAAGRIMVRQGAQEPVQKPGGGATATPKKSESKAPKEPVKKIPRDVPVGASHVYRDKAGNIKGYALNGTYHEYKAK